MKGNNQATKPEARRGAEAQACDCKRNRFEVLFQLEEIKYVCNSFMSLWCRSKAQRATTKHAMLPEFSGKCEREVDTSLPHLRQFVTNVPNRTIRNRLSRH